MERASLILTIEDDDAEPNVSIARISDVNETDIDFTNMIAVTLDNASGKTVTVPYSVSSGTAGSDDYILADGTVTFTPDTTTTITSITENITYTIKGDSLNEVLEQFTVMLGTPTNGVITGQNITCTVRITDNDDFPTISIADADGDEGNSTEDGVVEFIPTLNVKSGRDIVITYSTTAGGDFPAEENDYTPVANEQIMIPAGRTSPVSTIRIVTSGDTNSEPDETFILNYSADYATVSDETTIGIINNDDEQVLAISTTSVSEDVGIAELIVNLSPAPSSGQSFEVMFSMINRTAEGSSDGMNADFKTISSNTIVFDEGEKSKTLQIQITDDDLDENTEFLNVIVTTLATGVTYYAGGIGTLFINDNDPPPTLALEVLDSYITRRNE